MGNIDPWIKKGLNVVMMFRFPNNMDEHNTHAMFWPWSRWWIIHGRYFTCLLSVIFLPMFRGYLKGLDSRPMSQYILRTVMKTTMMARRKQPGTKSSSQCGGWSEGQITRGAAGEFWDFVWQAKCRQMLCKWFIYIYIYIYDIYIYIFYLFIFIYIYLFMYLFIYIYYIYVCICINVFNTQRM